MLYHEKSKSRFMFLLLLATFLTASTVWTTHDTFAQCARPGFKIGSAYYSTAASKAVTGDFNGDSKPDVATMSFEGGKVAVYFGDGLGNLGTPAVHLVGTGAAQLITADMNNDGKLDLVLTFHGSPNATVSILFNNGSGVFGFPVNTSQGVSAEGLRVADFNGDGKGDLVSGASIGSNPVIQIRFGDGAGNFTAPFSNSINGSRGYVIGDFNTDGKNDLAFIFNDAPNRQLVLFLNDGSGTLVQSPNPFLIGTNSLIGIVGDFNNDGKQDIAGFTQSNNSVMVLLNNSPSGFTRTDYPVLSTLNEVGAGDFNGDGKLDIITTQYNSPTPTVNSSILFNNGTGSFTRSDSLSFLSLGWTLSGALSDFNVDGKTDVVVPVGGGIRLYLRTCNDIRNTKRIDYTGDGYGEFAVWRPSNGNWIIKLGFNNFRTVQWGLGSLGDVPVPGDYDGDGISDLAVFRAPTGGWYVLKSSDGSGFGIHWGASGDKPAPGDYDADGKTDFAVFRPSDGGWYILKSSDNTMASYAFGLSGDKPVQADYDNDDRTDVAVYRPSTGTWYILRSSDNSFVGTHFGISSDKPLPGDYDGDGKADITVYRSGEGFYILRSWNNSLHSVNIFAFYGIPTPQDQPAPYGIGDIMDFSLWRPSEGSFVLYLFNGGVVGMNGDIPVTAPYVIE